MLVYGVINNLFTTYNHLICSRFLFIRNLTKEDYQLFALVIHRHDMDAADVLQIAQCRSHIEHGREFDHDRFPFLNQQGLQAADIGFAFGNGYCFSSMTVTAGRVKEQAVDRFHRLKVLHCIGAMDAYVRQAQQREVMGSNPAERFLPLYIVGTTEIAGRKEQSTPHPAVRSVRVSPLTREAL
mgnify:CR=1 FL=1